MANTHEFTIPLVTDTRSMVKTARVIAKHMNALADDLSEIDTELDDSQSAAEAVAERQATDEAAANPVSRAAAATVTLDEFTGDARTLTLIRLDGVKVTYPVVTNRIDTMAPNLRYFDLGPATVTPSPGPAMAVCRHPGPCQCSQ